MNLEWLFDIIDAKIDELDFRAHDKYIDGLITHDEFIVLDMQNAYAADEIKHLKHIIKSFIKEANELNKENK